MPVNSCPFLPTTESLNVSDLSVEHFDDVLIVRFHTTQMIDPLRIKEVGEQLLQAIDDSQCRKILLDLSDMSAMSSELLGKLILVHKSCGEAGVEFKLCGLPPQVQKVLHLMRLDSLFEIHKDRQHAIASFVTDS